MKLFICLNLIILQDGAERRTLRINLARGYNLRRRHRHNHRGDGYEEENQIEKNQEDDQEKGKKRAILYFLSPLAN